MSALSRRRVLRIGVLGLPAATAACARTVTPASPAAAPLHTAPTTSPPPAAAEGTTGTPGTTGTTGAAEWEELVAAAGREGRLSLLTGISRGYLRMVEAFEAAFPGIAVEHVAETYADAWVARVRGERRAGTHAFDLGFLQTDRALTDGKREGFWAPLKPLLFHPEIVDDRAWRHGFGARFVDAAGDLCFSWSYSVFHAYAINTDFVAEGEITSVRDLLDPRWRGRIISGDPRTGTGLLSAASATRVWGSAILRPLLVDQRPVIVNAGPDGVTGPLARGEFAIALGVRPKALDPLREKGIGLQVRYLDLPDADFVPSGSLLHFDRAPHPAAARLFANWILTREGQTVLAGALQTNSARTDLPPFQTDETSGGAGAAGSGAGPAYYEPDRETNFAHTAATQAFIRGMLSRVP